MDESSNTTPGDLTHRYVIGIDMAEGEDTQAELQLEIGHVFFLSDDQRFDTRRTVRKVATPLTDEEKIAIGDEITEIQSRIDHIESLKKQIAGLREEMSVLSNKYRNGLDTESVECTVYYDCPRVGQKTIVRDDTREIVEISDMNDEEMQGNLPFDGTLSSAPADVQDEPAAEPDASADAGNVYTIPENPDVADAEMEAGYALAAAERED